MTKVFKVEIVLEGRPFEHDPEAEVAGILQRLAARVGDVMNALNAGDEESMQMLNDSSGTPCGFVTMDDTEDEDEWV